MVQRKFIYLPAQAPDADHGGLNGNSADSMYAMEFLKHGSADGLLRKISEQDLTLRDDELWMIFHCREPNTVPPRLLKITSESYSDMMR